MDRELGELMLAQREAEDSREEPPMFDEAEKQWQQDEKNVKIEKMKEFEKNNKSYI